MKSKTKSLVLILIGVLLLLASCEEEFIVSYPPFVLSTDPSDTEEMVSISAAITVRFSEVMDQTTFNLASFKVGDGHSGTFTFSAAYVTFHPTEPLQHSTVYTVIIAKSVRDKVGDTMEQSYTFSFKTGGLPPTITDFQPKSGYEGDLVTIYGINFGNAAINNAVYIGTSRAHIVEASPERLVIEVPMLSSTGTISISSSGFTIETVEQFQVLYHGLTWSSYTTATTSDLNDICIGNGSFLVVGNEGALLTSPDGIRWEVHDAGVKVNLYGAAIGNGRHVAVGASGVIMFSDDGVNWTRYIWAPEATFFDVEWTGTRFLISGSFGLVLESSTGQSWVRIETGVGNWLYDVMAYDDDYVFVGSGGIILSTPNFVQWKYQEDVTVAHLLESVRTDSTLVVIGHTGTAWVLFDEGEWVQGVTRTAKHLLGVDGFGSRLVAVGTEGTILATFDRGYNWIKRVSPTNVDLTAVIWDRDRYIAVGQNGIVLISN